MSRKQPSFLSQPREIVKLPDKILDKHEDIGDRGNGEQLSAGKRVTGSDGVLCYSHYFNLINHVVDIIGSLSLQF